MNIRRPNHIGICVTDLAQSLSFYSRLGFELATRWRRSEPYIGDLIGVPGAEVESAILRFPGSDLVLELSSYSSSEGTPVAPHSVNPGAIHIGLTVDDLDELHARLTAEGVEFVSSPVTPTVGPNAGGRAVLAVDPDRVRIELIQTSRTLDGQSLQDR